MSDGYPETMEWLNLIQTSAPESKTKILLTKVDQMDEEDRKSKTKKFCDEFSKRVQNEIEQTKQHIKESCGANKAVHEKHLKNFEYIKSQLHPDKVLCVSCVTGWEGTVTDAVKVLTDFAKEHKDVGMLEPIDQELFISIGKLGIRDDMTLEFPKSKEEKHPERELATDGMFDTPAAMKMFREKKDIDFQSESTDTKEILRQQYVTFEEVENVFRPILEKYYPDKMTQLKLELQNSLVNLKKRGLLGYFTGNKKLEDIIFNDISTMVNILRCVFHHNRDAFLYETTHTKYQADLEEYKEHGVVSSSLIKVLLKKCSCSIDSEVVIHLLHRLSTAIVVPDEQSPEGSEKKVFIPFFLEDVKPDESIEEKKKEISKCHKRVLSMHTILVTRNRIPRPFFHQLLVKLSGEILEKLRTQKNNKTWKDGISVSLGNNQGKLMMIYKSDKEIEFIIQANIQDPVGHHLIWKYIKFVNTTSKDLRESKFPGLPVMYYLKCTHCNIANVEPEIWDIDDLLRMSHTVSTLECKRTKTGFTRTLVAPLSEGKFPIHFN